MKTKAIVLTPDEIAEMMRLGKEREVRGDPLPHSHLHLPDGMLVLLRLGNMPWFSRRAQRNAIVAARVPQPDEICSRCGAPLSDGSPAYLVFCPGSMRLTLSVELSMLCYNCAALPDEELLAAAAEVRKQQDGTA
jgi:hypothetical protein